jgi:hypothetical protein
MHSRLDTRLRHLERQTPDTAWGRGQGLASLLAHAKQYPIEAFGQTENVYSERPPRGLAQLL